MLLATHCLRRSVLASAMPRVNRSGLAGLLFFVISTTSTALVAPKAGFRQVDARLVKGYNLLRGKKRENFEVTKSPEILTVGQVAHGEHAGRVLSSRLLHHPEIFTEIDVFGAIQGDLEGPMAPQLMQESKGFFGSMKSPGDGAQSVLTGFVNFDLIQAKFPGAFAPLSRAQQGKLPLEMTSATSDFVAPRPSSDLVHVLMTVHIKEAYEDGVDCADCADYELLKSTSLRRPDGRQNATPHPGTHPQG